MRIRRWLMRPPYVNYPRGGRGGFIYVVCGSGQPPLKIGVTSNPTARIAQLKTGSAAPLAFSYIGALNCSGYEIEAAAHETLARYRVMGEWFSCTPEIAIAAISVASARLGEPIASVDPSRVDEIVAAVSWRSSPASIGYVLMWCYFIVLAGIAGLLIMISLMGKG